jgi:poly(3-hydroxybutyrate) depolymerase
MLSEILACEAWDVFASVASVAGVVEYKPGGNAGMAICDQNYNASRKTTSILALHGQDDIVVPWYGDALLGYPCVDENTFLGSPCDIHEWMARNECVHASNTTWTNGPYSNKRFSECSGGAVVELITCTDCSHEWPVDSHFNSTAYIVEWLLSGNHTAHA